MRVLLAMIAGCGAAAAAAGDLQRFQRSERHMATAFTIVAYADTESVADAALTAAFARIAALDARLNDYNPDSELSALSRRAPTAEPVAVSDDLWRVLERSQAWARRTDGAFDATVGPLTTLWRQARVRRRLAAPERLAAARAAVGHGLVRLDADGRGVALAGTGMRFDLGGIAQGFAADAALAVLHDHGLERALVNASGDIACGLPPPGKEGWTIGIAATRPDDPPTSFVRLAGCGISTSGDAFQSVEIDGVRYSHIVDPRTGLGLTERRSATVIAPDCTTADALATALCVLGADRGLALVETLPGVEARIVTAVEDAAGEDAAATRLSSAFPAAVARAAPAAVPE